MSEYDADGRWFGEREPKVAHHSSATVEHYTPIAIIEAARATMGGIDLDPATTRAVNDANVRAPYYFTREQDGLKREWHGRVFLNPPGGRSANNKSMAAMWWARLAHDYAMGLIQEAIFIGFTLEILATSQDAKVWIGDMPFCVPRKRTEFLKESDGGLFVPGDSPTHSNVLVYLPPRGTSARDVDAPRVFAENFAQFGRVSYRRTVDRQLPLAMGT